MSPGRDHTAARALTAAGTGLLIVGVLALLAGWVYGSRHVHVRLQGERIDCGTVFSVDKHAETEANLTRGFLGLPAGHPCSNAIGDRRPATHLLMWGGGAVAVVAVVGLLIPGVVIGSDPDGGRRG